MVLLTCAAIVACLLWTFARARPPGRRSRSSGSTGDGTTADGGTPWSDGAHGHCADGGSDGGGDGGSCD